MIARKPTQRAFDDERTIWAARSGVSVRLRAAGGALKRSTGAGSADGRVAGSRCSGSPPGVSVIDLLVGRVGSRRQMQPVGVRGGMSPGWPSAIGSGPSVILPVLMVSLPAPSTMVAKRSMPRGAGPNCAPSALIPRRS